MFLSMAATSTSNAGVGISASVAGTGMAFHYGTGGGRPTTADRQPAIRDNFPLATTGVFPVPRRLAFIPALIVAALYPALVAAQPAAGAPAALDPARALTQYLRAVWQRGQGLPQNTVQAVLQTRDGYLWVGTGDGLVRFDGVRFTTYDSRTQPVLGTDDISSLLEDRQGVLWVGTLGGGLFTYRGGVLAPFTGGALPHSVITDLYEASDGALWIATAGGVSRLAAGALTTYTTAQGLPSATVRAVTADRQGAIWVATEDGVARLGSGRFVTIAAERAIPSKDARAIFTAHDGTIWIGTRLGLVSYRDGTFAALTRRDGLPGEFIRAIAEDAAGTLWIGTQDGGMARLAGGRIDRLGTPEGFPSNDVRAFATDAEGDLWVGTNVGGLVRLKDPSVSTYGRAEGLPSDIVLPVAADRDGALWLGTYGGGIARAARGQGTPYSTRDGLSSDVILSLAPAAGGGMWVGTRDGLSRVTEGGIRRLGRGVGVPEAGITGLLEDRSGTLWIGTRTGAYRYDGTRASPVPVGSHPGANVILTVYQSKDGTVWFGTEGAGVARWSGGRLETFDGGDGLANAVVWTISEDQDGAVWFGTNGGGAIRYRDGRLTTYRAVDGLIDDTIFRILDDESGSLWFSSNQGIQRVARQQFAAFDARRVPQVTGRLFAEADGMRSSECNGGIQPAGWRTADGVLWFPTIKGVVRIDPTALAANVRPPPVLIERIAADTRDVPLTPSLSLPPGVRSLEFQYTALSLRSPDKVRFRYRLEGFDPDWVDGGNRRTAFYTNIEPGTYTFRVAAANEDGVWNEAGAAAGITLEPYFTQTTTFYVLPIALLGFVFFGLYRARISGLKAREQELSQLAEERRWAIEALEESEAKFRTLFENVNEGVYRATDDGRLVLANRSMARLLGYDEVDELLQVRAPDLYVNPEEYARLMALARESGEARAVEVRLRCRDGREVAVLESTRAVVGADDLVYFEGTVVDITDRKQLEEQLLQLQKIESIGRLAGAVAHDFNNLLTPILGQTELLAESLPEGDPRRARADQIRKGALSARSLTRQLLAFSRRQIVNRRVIDLNDVIVRLEEMLTRLMGEHIHLRLDLAPDLLNVCADPGQIEQVIMNFAVNARDVMPTGGTLTIHTRNAGANVVLGVSDTGPGINEDVRERLFEPFVTTKRHGLGLGLSTVQAIVTQSGGRIAVESHLGRGTRFDVFLPAVDGIVVDAMPERRVRGAGRARTILLVEDDHDVRDIACEVLEREGYTVLAAASAEAAEEIEAGHPETIDLLLTDVVMPGLGGPALAERLRQRRPGLRVLYTTGYIDDDVAHHGVLQPDAAVLEKPFTLDALLEAVRQRIMAG